MQNHFLIKILISNIYTNKIFTIAIVLILVIKIPVFAQNSEFTDVRDGNKYKTVKIEDQIWMAENLNFQDTNSYIYDNEKINGYVYGRLYPWKIAKNVCPEGWHLPTDFEWDILINGIDDPSVSGGRLKKSTHWSYPNKGAFYQVGFDAMPGGFYSEEDNYQDKTYKAYFWSQTEINSDSAEVLILKHKSAWATRTPENKQKAFSVRCLKN